MISGLQPWLDRSLGGANLSDGAKLRFVGNKCSIETFNEAFLPIVRRHLNDPDVTRHIFGFAPEKIDGVLTWLRRSEKSTSSYVFSILRHIHCPMSEVHAEFVGVTSLRIVRGDGSTALSGTIIGAKNLWGTGLGYEANRLKLNFAFRELGTDSIFSAIAQSNNAACRLLTSLGYEKLLFRPDFVQRLRDDCGRVYYRLSRDKWWECQSMSKFSQCK
jgi:RimJ/RimL family protein N-acetyltransferase